MTFNQLPASGLTVNAVAGDNLTLPFDFDINLTGYTISFTCTGITTSMSNTLSTGLINVTFTPTSTAGVYPWVLKWTDTGGSIRTVVTGELRLI